jgi:hypothetical protein
MLLLAGTAALAGAATTGIVPVAATPRDLTETAPTDDYQPPVFDRYQPIIARMPFGVAPPPPPPAAVASSAAAAAAAADPGKNFVLFEIVRAPVGDVMVGFTDNNPKPSRSLLLAVGEEADGYRVAAADIDAETATLEKDGASFELRLNSSTPTNAAGASHPAWPGNTNLMSMAAFPSRMAKRGLEAIPPPVIPAGIAGSHDNSYVNRLRDRREQLLKQTEEEQRRHEQEALSQAQSVSTDVIDKRLHETNLNLIRKGLKPIGTIELTPEEDAKLVSEGVLPAP